MHPNYPYPYYPDRSDMTMPDMDMEQMKQMMMEHMETTKQIQQTVNMIEEQLRRIEIFMRIQ